MDEYIQYYRWDFTKAYKSHVCCECYGAINKKEYYFRHRGILNRTFVTYKVCSDCEYLKLKIKLDLKNKKETICFEELSEWVVNLKNKEYLQEYCDILRKRCPDRLRFFEKIIAKQTK